MDRAETRHLLALRGEMDRGENNRAGIRVTRPQIVDELLAEIVGRVDVEDEEGRLLVEGVVDYALYMLDPTPNEAATTALVPGTASSRAEMISAATFSSGSRTRTSSREDGVAGALALG